MSSAVSCETDLSSTLTLTKDHLLNCNGSNVMNTRHDAIKNTFAHLFKQCKLKAEFEELAGPGTGKICRFDVSADRYNADNKDLKVDVTVVNPCTRSRAKLGAVRPGAAAVSQRHKKVEKYAPYLTPSDDFYPLVFETFGLIDMPVFGLINSIADRVNNLPPETATWAAPTFKSYAIQRLSCCLWRENARQVETVIINTALVYEYEKYSYAAYEDAAAPVFQLNTADFPALSVDTLTSTTTITDNAETSAPVAAAKTTTSVAATAATCLSDHHAFTDHADIASVQDLVDLTLDDGFPDHDDSELTVVPLSVSSSSVTSTAMTTTTSSTGSIAAE